MQQRVYLSLGSNLGGRFDYIEKALALLQDRDLTILRRSSLYKTAPRDLIDQPWFLNIVVEAQTRLFPHRLLARIRKVERQLGRRRTVARGPRTIDIDVLLFGHLRIDDTQLIVPHPRMTGRRFVLEPLSEIADPRNREALCPSLECVKTQQVRKLNKFDSAMRSG